MICFPCNVFGLILVLVFFCACDINIRKNKGKMRKPNKHCHNFSDIFSFLIFQNPQLAICSNLKKTLKHILNIKFMKECMNILFSSYMVFHLWEIILV
jgi:thioredoxin-related protein